MKTILFLAFISISFLSNAQIDFADTAIESAAVDTTNPGRFKLKAKIVSNEFGNNASHGVKIVILLPEARLYSYSVRTERGIPLSCSVMRHISAGVTHPVGYLICDGRTLQRRTSTSPDRFINIKVETGVPDPTVIYPIQTNFSIMTYNLVPDNNMKNNFWSWK